MVRIAPVRLAFNPRTLWFDAAGNDLHTGDDVVVFTARGPEFGTVAGELFEMQGDDAKKLKSPLKPVRRKATDEDRAQEAELERKAAEALPRFRQLAHEIAPAMNPIAVEYLFDSDKAVFYFESEERIDFRNLVRKLASEFHVRVDMKQIGVRDGTRMVGGLGHCGQELCCRRLGGEFNPVSIRMAKEQDLSLNPTKISGTCGRLMCCLRYEYDAYKDFHSRAPKKNAKITTPDGEGKVVDMDVPREIISVKVGDEKPVKVPLADFDPPTEGARPNQIGEEAWAAANEPPAFAYSDSLGLFTNPLTGEDQLAQPGTVRHVHEEADQRPGRSRRRRGGKSESKAAKTSKEVQEAQAPMRKPRRRRTTTVTVEDEALAKKQHQEFQESMQSLRAQVQSQEDKQPKQSKRRRDEQSDQPDEQQRGSSRRRQHNRSQMKQAAKAKVTERQYKKSQRSAKQAAAQAANQAAAEQATPAAQDAGSGAQVKQGAGRRRRRSHRSDLTAGE